MDLNTYLVSISGTDPNGTKRNFRVRVHESSGAAAEGRAERWAKQQYSGGKWFAVFTADQGPSMKENPGATEG